MNSSLKKVDYDVSGITLDNWKERCKRLPPGMRLTVMVKLLVDAVALRQAEQDGKKLKQLVESVCQSNIHGKK